jgi:hypothetical protein
MTWWVVRASQTPPAQTGAVLPGLHAQKRVVPPSYRADPLAIRAELGYPHLFELERFTHPSIFPGGTPRTFSCEGAPRSTQHIRSRLQHFRWRTARLSPWLEPGGLRRSKDQVNSYTLLHTGPRGTLQVLPTVGYTGWPTHPAVHMGTGRRRTDLDFARTRVQNQE